MQSEKQIAAAQGVLGRGGVYVGAELMKAAIEAALSAAAPQPAPSVAVKELEWSPRNDQPQYEVCADTPFGRYKTSNKGEYGFGWMQPRQTVWSGFLPTLEEAKAAAQADYEARIRSAIVGGLE